MKRKLRHPVRSIREPFGKAGLTVAILALVLAMVGGAYAAGALSGKQKKEVEKIAKKYAGKTGSAGSQGPAGPAGAKGDTGTNGKDGTNGTNGTNGKEGPEGKQGKEGTTGFTETLPSGKTETGSEGFGDGGLADIGGRSSVRRV
jgi:hypothetical protein